MKILTAKMSIGELNTIAAAGFGEMVKAVVDVERELVAIDAELHADLESLLLENGSRQPALWGINFYPGIPGDDFIEFDSMINIRPSAGNRSRGVENETLQKKIREIAAKWIQR